MNIYSINFYSVIFLIQKKSFPKNQSTVLCHVFHQLLAFYLSVQNFNFWNIAETLLDKSGLSWMN